MNFALDASVALNWCLAEKSTEVAVAAKEALATGVAVVPPLWFLEVGNVLAVAERRGRIQPGTAMPLFADLLSLPIEVAGLNGTLGEQAKNVLSRALEHQISTYDATYLLLAVEKRLPLGG